MRVLQTKYDGHHFRSRLEARWAVFFKELKIPYLYELDGFDLGEAGWYLPDFFLPGVPSRNDPKGQKGIWIEVKPIAPEETYCKKLYALVEDTQLPLIVLIGAVSSGSDFEKEYEEYRWWDSLPDTEDHVTVDTGMLWHKCYKCGKIKIDYGYEYQGCFACDGHADSEHPSITAAVTEALSERFGT